MRIVCNITVFEYLIITKNKQKINNVEQSVLITIISRKI